MSHNSNTSGVTNDSHDSHRCDSHDYELIDRLAEEIAQRVRRGERPSMQEYLERYPRQADALREFLPALLEIEDAKIEAQAPEAAVAVAPPPLQQLGDFHILREIGRGGMGVVYEAEQVSLGRRVALKILPNKAFADARQKRRFEREAKAAARLHHTNIVPIFFVGDHDGMPYYVMQHIQGLGLDEVIEELGRLGPARLGTGPKGEPLPPTGPEGHEPRISRRDISAKDMARSLVTGHFTAADEGGSANGCSAGSSSLSGLTMDEEAPMGPRPTRQDDAATEETRASRLSDTFSVCSSSAVVAKHTDKPGTKETYFHRIAHIGVQVAGALEYAHNQNILHRDIKPSNLLLDTRGVVWVTDFGLAKVEDQPNLTRTGDVLGTLRYMPPEAFEGKSDPRSDVYSLGLTLYELVALRPAFDERDRRRLIKQVTDSEPTRLEKLNHRAPRDLVTIIHKAIDRDAAQRYQTTTELRADLQRFLDDEPIQARRVSPAERLMRWSRRNKSLATALSAVALLLIVVALGSTLTAGYFRRTAASMTLLAEEKQGLANKEQEARTAAEREKKQAETLAEKMTQLADAERQARKLIEVREKEARWHLYKAQMFPIMEAWRERDFGRLERLLEEASPKPGEPDFRGWEWYYFQDQCRLASRVLKGSALYSGPGDWCRKTGKIAVLTNATTIDIWDPAAGKLERTLTPKKGWLWRVAWSPDGSRLACVAEGKAIICEAASGKVLHELVDKNAPPHEVAWSPDGTKLATGGRGAPTPNAIVIWNALDGRPLRTLATFRTTPTGLIGDVYSLAWHPDGIHLAAGLRFGNCAVWDTTTGKRKFIVNKSGDGTPLFTVAWSPDGKKLAAGHVPGMAVYNEDGEVLHSGLKAGHIPNMVRWSPDSKHLLSGAKDQTVRLWDGATGKELRTLRIHGSPVHDVAWSPDGKRVMSVGLFGDLRISDPFETPPRARALTPGLTRISELHWSPDGRWLACATFGFKQAILDAHTGEVKWWLPGRINCWSTCWSPDSSRLVTLDYGSPTGKALFWDMKTGLPQRVLRVSTNKSGGNNRVEWSGDGKWIAVANFNANESGIWDTATWQPTPIDSTFFSCAFSPDSRLVAFRGYGSRLWIWDLNARTWAAKATVLGSQYSSDLTWSPDSRLIAATLEDGGLAIVRAEDGNRVHTAAQGHKAPARRVCWSPDGRRIATSSTDGTVKIWDAATCDVLVTLPCADVSVTGLSWSPDSRQLACGSFQGTIQIFGSPYITATPPSAQHLETGVLASVKSIAEEWREQETALIAKANAQPKNAKAWQELATFYQVYRRWEQAADAWDRCAELTPKATWIHCAAAQVHAMAGHQQAYRDCRDRVIALLAANPKGGGAFPSRALSVLPGANKDDQVILDAALRAAKDRADKWHEVYSPGPALYRMGRYAEARPALEQGHKLAPPTYHAGQSVLRLWLAMTYHQLGQIDEAKHELAQANEMIRKWFPKPGQPLQPYNVGDYIESALLQKEATALILGQNAPTQPADSQPPIEPKALTLADELKHPDGPFALWDLAAAYIACKRFKMAEDLMDQVDAQLDKLSVKYPVDTRLQSTRQQAQRLRRYAAFVAQRFGETESTPLAARTAASLLSPSQLQPWETMASILSGGVIQWQSGELTKDCAKDTVRKDSFARVYEVQLEKGTMYSIDLESSHFDAYLRLETLEGKLMLSNDDGDAGLNSRLVFTMLKSGTFRVVVTSFDANAIGPFVLTIRK